MPDRKCGDEVVLAGTFCRVGRESMRNALGESGITGNLLGCE